MQLGAVVIIAVTVLHPTSWSSEWYYWRLLTYSLRCCVQISCF